MSQTILGSLQSTRTIQPAITITGAASSAGLIAITAAAHGLLTGDIVQIAGIVGTVEANGQWVVTKTSSSVFTLNNSTFATAYSSGGIATHLGFVVGSISVDNTVFPTMPDFALTTRLESLSAASGIRIIWEDSTDSTFVAARPLGVQQAIGDAGGAERMLDRIKRADTVDSAFGKVNGHLRAKVFVSGPAFSTVQLSCWATV